MIYAINHSRGIKHKLLAVQEAKQTFKALFIMTMYDEKYKWAMRCQNVPLGTCRQWKPLIRLCFAQSDQGLHCLQTESLDTIECMNGDRSSRYTVCMHRMIWMWSEKAHFAQDRRHFFDWSGPHYKINVTHDKKMGLWNLRTVKIQISLCSYIVSLRTICHYTLKYLAFCNWTVKALTRWQNCIDVLADLGFPVCICLKASFPWCSLNIFSCLFSVIEILRLC